MVRRLLVVLLSVSFGFSVLCHAQPIAAQTEPGKKAPVEKPAEASSVAPVRKVTDSSDAPSDQDPAKAPTKSKKEKAGPKSEQKAGMKPVTITEQELSKQDEQESKEKQKSKKADDTKKDGAKNPDTDAAKPSEQKPTKKMTVEPVTKTETDSKEDAVPKQDAIAKSKAKAEVKLRSEFLLPASTKAWVSIPDADALKKQFELTQLGELSKDPSLEPFIASLRDQIKNWVNDQNVRFGIKLTDLEGVHTGEICVAGVFPDAEDGQAEQSLHGLVFLMDVSATQEKAVELQKKINAELLKRGAEQKVVTIHDVEVMKSVIKKPKRFRRSRTNLQVVVNGWMLVSDNESVFRDILSRLTATKKAEPTTTLAGQPKFQTIMERASLGEWDSQVKWFVDPFGYLKLVEKIEAEDRATRVAHDDFAEQLRANGFDVIQGVGGNVGIATGDHEILHRTFVYAPKNSKNEYAKHLFDLFEFDVADAKPLVPPPWVPAQCSSCIIGQWDFQKALDGVGHFYDGIIEEGEFERMLDGLKVDVDFQLDIRKMVSLLGNRFIVISAVEHPINEDSERVAIGFPITGQPEYVFNWVKRATQGRVINLGGVSVIKVETVAEDDDLGDLDVFEDPDDEELEEEEEKPKFELFKERYFVVSDGYLIVANNKEYIRELINQKKSKLGVAPDYLQVKEALGNITVANNVRWRQFGRLDRALEANYEMMRRGEMAKSQTVMARLINRVFSNRAAAKAEAEGKKSDPDAIREQQIDGSKLPADYATSIAPFLGPVGWVLENEANGWRVTGCLLKKKGKTEVVQKVGEGDADSSKR